MSYRVLRYNFRSEDNDSKMGPGTHYVRPQSDIYEWKCLTEFYGIISGVRMMTVRWDSLWSSSV